MLIFDFVPPRWGVDKTTELGNQCVGRIPVTGPAFQQLCIGRHASRSNRASADRAFNSSFVVGPLYADKGDGSVQ